MGRYASIDFRLTHISVFPDILRKLSQGLHAIGIAAFADGPGNSCDWFLGGYGIDSIVSEACTVDRGRVRSIEIGTSEDHSYYTKLKSAILSREVLLDLASPFEVCDEEVAITRCKCPCLSDAVIKTFSEWIPEHVGGVYEIALTTRLWITAEVCKENAFRHLDAIGSHERAIRILRLFYRPRVNELSLFTQCYYWFDAVRDLAVADKNLDELSGVVATMKEVNGVNPLALRLDGWFTRDSKEFEERLGIMYEPW